MASFTSRMNYGDGRVDSYMGVTLSDKGLDDDMNSALSDNSNISANRLGPSPSIAECREKHMRCIRALRSNRNNPAVANVAAGVAAGLGASDRLRTVRGGIEFGAPIFSQEDSYGSRHSTPGPRTPPAQNKRFGSKESTDTALQMQRRGTLLEMEQMMGELHQRQEMRLAETAAEASEHREERAEQFSALHAEVKALSERQAQAHGEVAERVSGLRSAHGDSVGELKDFLEKHTREVLNVAAQETRATVGNLQDGVKQLRDSTLDSRVPSAEELRKEFSAVRTSKEQGSVGIGDIKSDVSTSVTRLLNVLEKQNSDTQADAQRIDAIRAQLEAQLSNHANIQANLDVRGRTLSELPGITQGTYRLRQSTEKTTNQTNACMHDRHQAQLESFARFRKDLVAHISTDKATAELSESRAREEANKMAHEAAADTWKDERVRLQKEVDRLKKREVMLAEQLEKEEANAIAAGRGLHGVVATFLAAFVGAGLSMAALLYAFQNGLLNGGPLPFGLSWASVPTRPALVSDIYHRSSSRPSTGSRVVAPVRQLADTSRRRSTMDKTFGGLPLALAMFALGTRSRRRPRRAATVSA